MRPIPLALTYDDVLIVPQKSTFVSRAEANTRSRLTKKISVNIPIVSANMDTVTESAMAIAMARMGGVGIIHRFMTIEDNVEEIARVKRAQNLIIPDPYTIGVQQTIREARQFVAEHGVSGLLVTDDEHHLLGVLSRRDLLFSGSDDNLVEQVMTPRPRVIVGRQDTTFEEARNLLAEHKIEKLPLVDDQNHIVGLITIADLEHLIQFPQANVDARGRLMVGGSIGVTGDYVERAQALLVAGVDFLVIDIAHGHSELMLKAIAAVRQACGEVQLIAGNIATAAAAQELCAAGVDAVKVGVGPGTTCITRLVTGCGVPQLSAVLAAAEVARSYGVPVIADGGIQRSGDIVKALGAGADTVMCGGSLVGTDESPGVLMNRGGQKYKVCRGSASFAVAQRRKLLYQESKDLNEVVPEGVEAIVPYRGAVRDIIGQFVGGLKSGMSYVNAHSIPELQERVEFVQITAAGSRESGPHDLEHVK